MTDLQIQKLQIPEWNNEEICLKPFSSQDRDRFESEMQSTSKTKFENIRARVAIKTVCDENGNLIFTEADITELGNKSAAAMSRIFDEAMKINHITDDDVKELEKN